MGFTYQDIDIIFDWMRITPDERFMVGWMKSMVTSLKKQRKRKHIFF